MNRRHFLMSLGVAVATAPMAWAQTFAEQIVQQLVDQGYVNIQVEATLLGRLRISADGSGGQREIILNPRTGEILRDIWFDASGNPVPRLANSSGNSGSDDNGGDDNSGSDGGDDSSGSGGGDDNSGSDGGGDDKGDDDDKGGDDDTKNNRD